MAVRESTKRKYMAVAAKLRAELDEYDDVNAREFTLENNVAAAFLKDMATAGFIIVHDEGITWTEKPITSATMQPVFDLAEQRSREATERRKAKLRERAAANDAQQPQPEMKQEPLRFTQPEPVPQYVKDLEKRVAALEQLMIRRGVA